jgi:hypothetical protein
MVIHQEIIIFLNSKLNYNFSNRDDWINSEENKLQVFFIKKRTLEQGKKLLRMLFLLLGNKEQAVLMAQEFFYLSADIRNHQALKTTSFIYQDLDNYLPSCIDKTDDLITFTINELQKKYDFSKYDKKIPIIVKNVRQRIRRLNVNLSTTINDIKEVIDYKNKYDYEQIILIFNGKKVEGEITVKELDMKPQDILYVVFKKTKPCSANCFIVE